ncbi:MAG: hypothetical protein J6A21_01855 [Lentisphaeria bacterium]|nr:hypothetical protein [Lentisphaeria bacterium]
MNDSNKRIAGGFHSGGLMMYRQDEYQDEDTELELEQLRKLDKLRKLLQSILMAHRWLLTTIFFLVLGSLLAFVVIQTKYSPTRYLARLTLCFHPKHKGKLGQYDDKYVARILNRYSTKQAFADQGDGKDVDRMLVADNITITTDRKQPNNFFIMLYAKSEEKAVTLINEFAAVCVQEYAAERTKDLQQWKTVLEEEKKGVYKQLQDANSAYTKLTVELQMVSPEKDYEQLRLRMGEQQNALARMNSVLQDLQKRKNQISADLADVNPMILDHQVEIKEFFKELEKLDREIAQGTELYTDENPKMIALHSRRNALQKRMDTFLKGKKIDSVDEKILRKAELLSTEMKTVQNELDAKLGEKNALEAEVAECKRRIKLFNDNQPKLEKLKQERKSVQEAMQRLDESISEINYTLLMVKEDLFINEVAKAAVGTEAFSKKNIFISLFAAIVVTLFIAVLTALLEFFFGRVADAKEMFLYNELCYLGALPTSEKLAVSQDWEKIAFNFLMHKFRQIDPHVVFISALPGAHILPRFFSFMEWIFAMAGKKILVITPVIAEEQEETGAPDENQPDTMLVYFSGGNCFLPIASKKFLDPSEFELLKNDFKLLRETYDCIFINDSSRKKQHSNLFLEQISTICDAAMFAVGAGRTYRRDLRSLLSLQLKINIPIMTVLTEHETKNLDKDLNLEAEA